MNLDDLPGDSCAYCGVSIEHMRIDAIYCSRKCNRADLTRLEQEARWAARDNRKCPECGTAIPPERRADVIHCSKSCSDKASYRRNKGRMRMETRKNRSCIQCGGPIPESKRAGTKYCSKACTNAFYVGKRQEAWALLKRYTAGFIGKSDLPNEQ